MRPEDTSTRAARPSTSSPLTVEDLARMGVPELDRAYAAGRVPDSLAARDGTPHGRMLALAGPAGRGAAHELLRRVSASRAFPWRGKSFRSRDTAHGEGVNRAVLLGDVFGFDTRLDTSAVDGRPCIVLDYDVPENPFVVRAIRDELREVSPGLFLGPALLRPAGSRLILYFAIDTSRRG